MHYGVFCSIGLLCMIGRRRRLGELWSMHSMEKFRNGYVIIIM